MNKSMYVLVALVICGCSSAHDPFIIRNTTSASFQAATSYAGHSRKVLITENSLPPDVQGELLEQIEVGKIWYGTSRSVRESLADGARQIGADVVVEVKQWRQPSGFSWAAPHGSGKAFRIPAGTNVLASLKGNWL